MIKYEEMKTALNSFALDKMVVLSNHSCAPYFPGLLPNKDYFVKHSN
jgi:hypothetical protein